MGLLGEIIKSRRRELLTAWGTFAVWALSLYLFRYNHEGEAGFDKTLNSVFGEYVFGFLRYMVAPHLVTLLLALIAYIVGRAFLRLVLRKFRFRFDLEESLFSIGIGLGIISIFTFLVGLLKFLYPWLFGVLAVATLILGRRDLIHLYRIARGGLHPKGWSFFDWSLFLLIMSLVISVFFRCNNPSTGWDALNSHLAAPKFYLREHAVSFFLWIKFNNFPQVHEMLITLQMMVFKDPGSSLVFMFYNGAACFTYLIGARYFSRQVGLMAVIIFMVSPMIYQSSQGLYVEMTLVYFSTMVIYAMLAWYETRDTRWLVLTGISAGFACGVKYLGAAVIFTVLILIAAAYFLRIPEWEWKIINANKSFLDRGNDDPEDAGRNGLAANGKRASKAGLKGNSSNKAVKAAKGNGRGINNINNINNKNNKIKTGSEEISAMGAESKIPTRSGSPLILFACLGTVILWTVIFAAPWYIRNIALFANPFFPFYESIFGRLSFGTLNEFKSELSIEPSEMLNLFTYNLSFGKVISLFWETTFRNDHPNLFSSPNTIGPLFLALTPAALFVKRWRRVAMILVLYILLVFAYWFLLEKIKYIRYMLYIYPVHAVITAWGLSELFNIASFNFMKRSHLAWTLLVVAFTFIFWTNVGTKYGHTGDELAFTEQGRRDFYTEKLPGWPLVDEVNRVIGEGSNVLTKKSIIYGLGAENRRYNFDCPLIGDLHTYASYGDLMANSATGKDLFNWLKKYKADFLYFSQSTVETILYLPGITIPKDETFEQYFEVIARYKDFELYRLVAPGEPRLTGQLTEIEAGEGVEEEAYTPF